MSSLPPPHPSLPLPPQPAASSSSSRLPQHPHPAISYPSYYNSHYVQAFSLPTYPNQYLAQTSNSNYAVPTQSTGTYTPRPIWYEAGNNRCTHPGCTFTGSPKTVEIHMMDRHLIYPPGWDKRKKKSDWDADPSLKGKPIPIQGTNVILDTSEVLEAWIAERKRRFPTASRVEDKKRKLQEAVARGQLDIVDGSQFNKRQKLEHPDAPSRDKRPSHYQKSRSKPEEQFNRSQDSGWPRKTGTNTRTTEPDKIVSSKPVSVLLGSVTGSDGDEDDGAPEAVSSKIAPPISLTADRELEAPAKETSRTPLPTASTKSANAKRVVLQPKLPPKNPFGSRPTLLRNLLLPEIRVTVSNLSQAIRFIVDNNFLRDVELKPGQAAEGNKIRVVELDQDVQQNRSGSIS